MNIDGYELFGELYTLDQRIGNPNQSGNTPNGPRVLYRCDGGFVSGIQMHHASNGDLDHLAVACTYFEL